jgi:hypothetical protein
MSDPHEQQLWDIPLGGKLRAWEGPEEGGSASRRVKVEAKMTELRWKFSDGPRAEKAVEEKIYTRKM